MKTLSIDKDYNSQMKLLEIKDSEGDYLKTIKLSKEEKWLRFHQSYFFK